MLVKPCISRIADDVVSIFFLMVNVFYIFSSRCFCSGFVFHVCSCINTGSLKTNPIHWVARIIPQGPRQYWTSLDTTIQADWRRFLITHHLDWRLWIRRLSLRYMVNHGTQSQVFSNRCTPQS